MEELDQTPDEFQDSMLDEDQETADKEEEDGEEEEEKVGEDGEWLTRVRVQMEIYFTDEVIVPRLIEDAYFWKTQTVKTGVFEQFTLTRDSQVQDKRRVHSIVVLIKPDGNVRRVDIDFREDEENYRNNVRSEEKNTIVFEMRVGKTALKMNTSPGEVSL
jgi:hypothetical protein